jgi:hypothetical protein
MQVQVVSIGGDILIARGNMPPLSTCKAPPPIPLAIVWFIVSRIRKQRRNSHKTQSA